MRFPSPHCSNCPGLKRILGSIRPLHVCMRPPLDLVYTFRFLNQASVLARPEQSVVTASVSSKAFPRNTLLHSDLLCVNDQKIAACSLATAIRWNSAASGHCKWQVVCNIRCKTVVRGCAVHDINQSSFRACCQFTIPHSLETAMAFHGWSLSGPSPLSGSFPRKHASIFVRKFSLLKSCC